jgi:hypothetical protein
MEVNEEFEEDPLLIHFLPLKIQPDSVSSIPSNHHTKPSSSLAWRRNFFKTLSHTEKVPLPMPYSRFEKFYFSIQSMDSLQKNFLHHDVSFLWLTCKTQIQTSTSSDNT